MNTDLKYNMLTEHIIKTFYKVYNKLGYGFLEKVYDNKKIMTIRVNPRKSVSH